MAVEEARHVLSGDWITLDASSICCPEMEVTATEHSRRSSVIWVRLVGLYCKRFEFLPDDPVKVVHYANEGGDT